MTPFLTEEFGNPHSADHLFGWRAAAAIDQACLKISESIGCEPSEVIFTSGATEANNLALKGSTIAAREGVTRLVVSAIDHKSVLSTAYRLQTFGYEVAIVPVNKFGLIDLESLESEVRKGDALVSVSYVNSEIGVIQPMPDIVEICRRYGALIHTDATQAVGRLPFDFFEADFDLVSLSAHKIFGPKGIGALIVKSNLRPVLGSLLDGGGQQENNRAGTIPTFLAVGLAAALEIATREHVKKQEHIADLANILRRAFLSADPCCVFNGAAESRIAGNINVTLSQIEAQSLLARTSRDVAFSTSSACSSGSMQPSHVLRALGLNDNEIRRTIRLCVGEITSISDIECAASTFRQALTVTELAS